MCQKATTCSGWSDKATCPGGQREGRVPSQMVHLFGQTFCYLSKAGCRLFAHSSEGQEGAPRSCPRLTAGREMNPFFGLPDSVIPGAPLRGGSLLEELYLRVPTKDMCVVRGRRAGAGHLRVCDLPFGFYARAPFFPFLNLKMTLLEASNVELTLK